MIKRLIGFWSHIKESETPITQDTLKLANNAQIEGNTSSRNRKDKVGYSWRMKKSY